MRRIIVLTVVFMIASLIPSAGHAAVANRNDVLSTPRNATSPSTGLLVTTDGLLTPPILRVVSSLLGRTIVGQSQVGDSIVSLQFDKPISTTVVSLAAPMLTLLGGIAHVAPDLHATLDTVPNDPFFGRQSNLFWSSATAASSAGSGGTEDGSASDYSIQAPAIWKSTLGSPSVVVAVVDGGVVDHPDLKKQVIAGYDMISDSRVAHDGNGRDSNASDPGNWSDGSLCGVYPSNWHGTHVAGIIAASQNNKIGISGIAPGVKIEPVRVMGQCGGSVSDIIAGIRWASGGTVPGVPVNKNPAKIINVSLSSTSPTCPQEYQDVVDEARSRGSLIVVSAGNQHDYVSTRTPANCDGVLSVGATTFEGRRTTYSNAGPTLGMVAPGGGLGPTEGEGIWSTVDTGTKGPSKSTYAALSGTSFSAPAVSAGAALVASLGTFSPDEIMQVLKAAATTPPTYNAYFDCGTWCGAGILNLANIPAPVGSPVISGANSLGSTLTVSGGSWNGNPDDVSSQWLRDGQKIDGATGTSYVVTPDDLGRTLGVRTTAHKAGFPDFFGRLATIAIPKAATSVTLQLSATSAKRKVTRLTAHVTVTSPPDLVLSGQIGVYVGSTRVAVIDLDSDSADVTLPVFPSKGTVSIKAVYGGNSQLASSTSAVVKVKVTN